jgi:hypothetical protein
MVDILAPYIPSRDSGPPVGLIGRWSIDKFQPMERGAVNAALYQIDDDTYRQTVAAVRDVLAARGLMDIVTGDQAKINTTLLVSPQGIAYMPVGSEKHFVPLSLRNTPLRRIVGRTALASRETQYMTNLGGTSRVHTTRHPKWEALFVDFPPSA